MPAYTKELLPYLFCDDNNAEDTFDMRQAKRMQVAKEIRDITAKDNPADDIVTLTISGNALNDLLTVAQHGLRERAKAEAGNGAEYAYALQLYAVIDQARDQLAEGRMKAPR